MPLDLRDLAREWRELLDEHTELEDAPDEGAMAEMQAEFEEDTAKFEDLCGELGISPAEPDTLEWHANNRDPVLIPEDEFEDYAQELAADLGYVNEDASWPYTHIDWESAADELRMDYTSITYDGDDYLTRS